MSYRNRLLGNDRFVPVERKRSIRPNWFFLLAALLITAGCDSAKPRAVPPELLGTWQTQDPRHAGLFFKIEADKFSFSKASGSVEHFAMTKYEQTSPQPGGSAGTHVLYGSRDGQKLTVRLLYESVGGGQLMFTHQGQTVWTRDQGQNQ